jgi:transcriptional regulator with XRE-family HTH domain
MATKEEIEAERRRRGYWIKRARERRDLTLDALAELLGYAANSGSTISLWEAGVRPVPSDKFSRLVDLLELPLGWLVKPPLTDEERLDLAIQRASELEREDWEAGEGRDLGADVVRGVEPRRVVHEIVKRAVDSL